MRPLPHGLPPLLIHALALDECIEAYRAVFVGEPEHPDLPASFRSHYEMGMDPRREQIDYAVRHTGVSMWRNQDKMVAIARKYWPKLGEFVARVELRHGRGFNYLDPSCERDPEHLTTWGDPEKLAGAVVDIVPIDPP